MKKRIAFVLTLSMALSVFSAVSVVAKNSSDTSFSFTVTGKPSSTEARYKEDSSKVYVYYTEGAYTTAFQTWGTNSGSGGANTTKGGTAYVNKNVKSSISNYVFEQDYDMAYLKVIATNENNVGKKTSGKWSPDSTRNYTVVN